MSQLYVGSICVSDIPEAKLVTGLNGKKYLNITIWVNDNPDKYENIGSIHVSQSKDERERSERRSYIGNFKIPVVNKSVSSNADKKQSDESQDDAAWQEFLSR